MQNALLPILMFMAVVMSVFAIVSLVTDIFVRDRKRVQDRLDKEFHNKQRDKVKRSLLYKGADPFQLDSADSAQPRRTWDEWLQTLLDQSGLEMTKSSLLLYTLGSAIGCGLLSSLLLRSLLLGLVVAMLGAFIPLMYVKIKRTRRLEAMRRQLSDAFDLMARILRAGQSMGQAMQAVGSEFASPISEEFAYCSEQQNLGLAAELSMRDLARRTGLIEMNIFVVAVLVQRQVGGNLSEILEKLADVVRQRYKTRGAIQTLTAEGRMQAGILMSLPPLLLIAMLIVNNEYAMVLIQNPILLGAMAFFMLVGGLWIRKIVNFDF